MRFIQKFIFLFFIIIFLNAPIISSSEFFTNENYDFYDLKIVASDNVKIFDSSDELIFEGFNNIVEFESFSSLIIFDTKNLSCSNRIIEDNDYFLNITFEWDYEDKFKITQKYFFDKNVKKIKFYSEIEYFSDLKVLNENIESKWYGEDSYYWNNLFQKKEIPSNELLISKWLPHTILLESEDKIVISEDDLNKGDDIKISFINGELIYKKYFFKEESHMLARDYLQDTPPFKGIIRKPNDISEGTLNINFFDSDIKIFNLNHFPYLFGSGLILTEHADQDPDNWGVTGWDRRETVMFGSNDSTREDYGKKGFIGHNILYQVGVWTFGWADSNAGIYSHPEMKEIIDKIVWDYGYEIELHGKIIGRENVFEEVSMLKNEYGDNFRTWIDHGPSAFCESISEQGTIPESDCYILDILEDNDVKYVWNLDTNHNGFPYSENALEYSNSLTYHNNLGKNIYGFWTDTYWTKGGTRPTENDLNNMYNQKRLLISHTYYLAGNLPNLWYVSDESVLINETFDNLLVRMENYQNQNKLWIPEPSEGFDFLLKKQRVSIEPLIGGFKVKNYNSEEILGLSVMAEGNISSAEIEDGKYLIYFKGNQLVLPKLNSREELNIEVKFGDSFETPCLIYSPPHIDIEKSEYFDDKKIIIIIAKSNTLFDKYNKEFKINLNNKLENFRVKDNDKIIFEFINGETSYSDLDYNISFNNNLIIFSIPELNESDIVIENINFINSCDIINESGEYILVNDIIVDKSNCIQILADDVSLDCEGHKITSDVYSNGIYASGNNIVVKNCNVDMKSGAGIYYNNVNGGEISDNVVKGQSHGIYTTNADNIGIINNDLSNNQYHGIYGRDSDGNNITGNTIKKIQGYGIFLQVDSNNNAIVDNLVEGCITGIGFSYSKYNSVNQNRIYANGKGVYAYRSSSISVTYNDFERNRQDLYKYGSSVSFENNY